MRTSIRVAAPILFLIPVLVVVIALGIVATWQGRRLVDSFAERAMDQAAERVETAVHGYLTNAVVATKQIELQVADGTLDPQQLNSWRNILFHQVAANSEINSVTFGTSAGTATWVIRYPGQERLEYAIRDQPDRELVEYRLQQDGRVGEQLAVYGYDPRNRPWYLAALKADGPTWSEPYAWVGGGERDTTLGIAYARPIKDESGQLQGVVESDVSLQDVSRFLRQARAFESGEAFLIGRDGKLVGSSIAVDIVSPSGERMSAVESENALVARIGTLVGSAQERQAKLDERLRVDGEDYRIDIRPLANPWGLDWNLAVVVAESEIMSGVAAMRRQAWLIGGVVVLLSLVVGMLAARSVVRPVTALAEAVRKMGGGNLDDEVRVNGHREFEDLSDELNRMAVALKDRMRIRHSLSLAMEIQQKLLPEEPPKIPGLDVAGHSTYCDETGGDYFDFIELTKSDSNELIVVLGDVMGHGVAAALLMATARGILRSRAGEEDSLGNWLTHINRLLVADTGGERFMTMALLVCDPVRGRVRLASAGHDQPLMYDPVDDRFIELPDDAGLPLGLVEDEVYRDAKFDIPHPGAILLVGTDGLWESANASGEAFGKDRICEVIRSHANTSADGISTAIRQALATFQGDAKQDDDVTFVLVKFAAGPPAGGFSRGFESHE